MHHVTQVLERIEQGDPTAADELLPLVYDALRQLATQQLAAERSGQTLQATALVHEAYLRLLDGTRPRQWSGRGHFYLAAAEAMRRILVDRARHRRRQKHGGTHQRVELPDLPHASTGLADDELLALHEALDRLKSVDRQAAELVKLRYFAGLRGQEAAAVLGLAPRSADRLWAYARAFLFNELNPDTRAPTATPPADSHDGT